ncbi:MAG: type II toxin-antitoxin system RelE/ParE family toxin [Bacillota bacterium]
MEFEIILSIKALRQLKALDRPVQKRVKVAIERHLKHFPPRGDILKLEGMEGKFRLRVGDWRVTFRYQFSERQVHIAEVVHRSQVYR